LFQFRVGGMKFLIQFAEMGILGSFAGSPT